MKSIKKVISIKNNHAKIPLVFFGSGPVALKSLEFILQSFDVKAVITKPSTETDMQRVASNIPVFSVENTNQLNSLFASRPFVYDLAVLVDFGIIIPRPIIDSFKLGIVNSHFSLLPQWRGADPITFSILSGQAKTGVSLMLLDEKMDTGKLIAQKSLPIPADMTSLELTDRLIRLSNKILLEYLPKYTAGIISPRAQPHPERATYSRRLTKEDGVIDWSKSAEQIEREIRAYSGWPGSKTIIAGKEVTIIKARVADIIINLPIGTTVINDKELITRCVDKSLVIDNLKPAGKKEMTGKAFIAGHNDKLPKYNQVAA